MKESSPKKKKFFLSLWGGIGVLGYELQARTSGANAPEKFRQGTTIRIYREDVYKIISEGENIKIPPIKMNSINFKN